MARLIYIGIGTIVIIFVAFFGRGTLKFYQQEDKFIESEVHGVIVRIKDYERGRFGLTIGRSETKDTIEYSIYIGKFMKENRIKVRDSISKEANSHTVYFFMKRDSLFEKPIELYYY
jgi:hypothetical protein